MFSRRGIIIEYNEQRDVGVSGFEGDQRMTPTLTLN